MFKKDIVVIGSSSGGIDALRKLVADLPGDFPATVFIVQHTGPNAPGILDLILGRVAAIPTSAARDKEQFLPNHIYVAPPDRHLLVEPGRICLSRGPRENRFRPAVDPLFRSAAQVYGARVIGVILTGGLDDGTAGLWAIKQLGGTAIVQDPDDALVPSMPASALRYVNVDYCVPLSEMAELLVQLANTDAEAKGAFQPPEHLKLEIDIAKLQSPISKDIREIWEKTSYTCPECHGVLLRFVENGRDRFRCHTGHAYSANGLLAYLTEAVEDTIWTTIRTIEESNLLLRHMATHFEVSNPAAAAEFRAKAADALRRSKLVREAVRTHEMLNEEQVLEMSEA